MCMDCKYLYKKYSYGAGNFVKRPLKVLEYNLMKCQIMMGGGKHNVFTAPLCPVNS